MQAKTSTSTAKELDENQLDFELLTLRHRKQQQQQSSASSSSSKSTISSEHSQSGAPNLWPLYLAPRFIEHYITGDLIGSGAYAEVREAVHIDTLERRALKIVNCEYLRRQAPRALTNQRQEISLLRHLDHPNIVRMYECLQRGAFLYLALEYCPFNLHELLQEQPARRLPVRVSRCVFYQLCAALAYLHARGIVHRDVKPANMLLTNGGQVKLIDFGVSYILPAWSRSDECTNYEGTPLFQAPEVIEGARHYHGLKVDVWSCGVTLYVMLYGRYPFWHEALLGLYDKILAANFEPPPRGPPTCATLVHLLGQLLNKNHAHRPTIDQVMGHPWLRLRKSCDVGSSEPADFFQLLKNEQRSHLGNNQSTSGGSLSTGGGTEEEVKPRDVYRSMTVLAYLYKHHFPHLPITKLAASSSSAVLVEKLSSSPSISSTSPAPSSANSTASPTSDPNSIISDDPNDDANGEQKVEWGTHEQYQLMKVPQVRANRWRPPTSG